MKKSISDERREYQKVKITSNAIRIVFISLILDILYRGFILRESFYNFSDVIIILLVLSVYLLTEYTRQGIFTISSKNNNKKVLGGSVFAAILFGILMYFLNENYSYIRAIISSGIFFVIYFLIMYALNNISENRDK